MELSNYSQILRRRWPLISAATLLAILLGAGIVYGGRLTGSPRYTATAEVTVNCATPCGTYYPGISISFVSNALIPHVHDPAAVQLGRLPGPSGVTSLSAFIDAATAAIKVQATATSRSSALTAANRAAAYLAGIQVAKIRTATVPAIRFQTAIANRDQKLWLHFEKQLAQLRGYHPIVKAELGAKAGFYQNAYNQDVVGLRNLRHPVVPPAQSLPALETTTARDRPVSPLKTILPAAVIGFILSFALAAWLDSRQTPGFAVGLAGLATGRRQESASPADSDRGTQATPPVTADDRPLNEGELRSRLLLTLAQPLKSSAHSLAALIDPARPSFLVTSMSDAEPQSETAAGLALAVAMEGHRVVLIDADARIEITRFFGLAGRPGISDYMRFPDGSPRQLIYPSALGTGSSDLRIIPYGAYRADSPAVVHGGSERTLHGEAWGRGLADLAQAGVIVIVSGPTLNDLAGLVDLLPSMGGVVIATDRERSVEELNPAYDDIRRNAGNVLGLIVNPTKLSLRRDGSLGASHTRRNTDGPHGRTISDVQGHTSPPESFAPPGGLTP